MHVNKNIGFLGYHVPCLHVYLDYFSLFLLMNPSHSFFPDVHFYFIKVMASLMLQN